MNKKNTLFLFALCPILPAASNLGYGTILSCLILWLFLSSYILQKIIGRLELQKASKGIELMGLACSLSLFQVVLQGIFPVLIVSLELYIILTAFSFFIIENLSAALFESRLFPQLPFFVLFILLFSLVREFFGYGTISVPVPDGLYTITVFENLPKVTGFWGTTGAAFILLGFIVRIAQIRIPAFFSLKGK
ncbi:hypothetical protein K7I13_01420 [Brucepastera parasyntrophica]|uniref:hypothetical protein n=1 Tax=Brucepastera parasyntrophica TaxID=2880008 RepID=UPI00210C3D73|nr:hypothetical protein [Brucepastera parasyntrophica]ULQ60023.1 hypothetical protein K7I13_01420 [Brucepastera parasyntrophica]